LFFDSLHVFAENPFGVGIGGFRIVQHIEGRNAQETHNLYTQILSEIGIQGFIAFGLLIMMIFRQNLKSLSFFKKTREHILEYRGSLEENSKQAKEVKRLETDTVFLINLCTAIHLFLVARLILGAFGHDLYEMYWWIAAGAVMGMETCGNTLQGELEKIRDIRRI
jgi:hypothetical protein